MIIGIMSISGKILEPFRHSTKMCPQSLQHISCKTYLVIRSADFRVPTILAILSRQICTRFWTYRNRSSTCFVFFSSAKAGRH